MKILYLIDVYQHKGGASHALLTLAEAVKSAGNDIAIYCRVLLPDSDTPQILLQGNGTDVLNFYLNNDFQLIHWFKSGTTKIFHQSCVEIEKRRISVPIITTVCQKPSYKYMLLTPLELKYSLKIVLIDKASFNDHYCRFIDPSVKCLIYFGSTFRGDDNQFLKTNDIHRSANCIVFGRGSSMSKWAKTMIVNYDKIRIENKEFHIIGAGTEDNWLTDFIRKEKRTDIFVYGQLSFEDWINYLKQMDVFLYQLPLNAYSSIDGTMQQAMLLKKPIVYYGPEAPKELIENGISGFIAESEAEIVYYSELLANDADLRLKIGKAAKRRILQCFSFQMTASSYLHYYGDIIHRKQELVHLQYVGLNYKLIYYFIQMKYKCLYLFSVLFNWKTFIMRMRQI